MLIRQMKAIGNPTLEKISSNIREIRNFRNYSQEYVAAKIGLTQNGYSKIELGYTNVTIIRLYAIASALEVNIKDVLELDISKLAKIYPQKIQISEPGKAKAPAVNYFRTAI